MDGQRLILNDSLKIEGGSAGYSGGYLWLYVPGWTMTRAAQVFMNQKYTEKIEFQYGDMSDIYRGYTNCTNIMTDGGQVSVCLVKG